MVVMCRRARRRRVRAARSRVVDESRISIFLVAGGKWVGRRSGL